MNVKKQMQKEQERYMNSLYVKDAKLLLKGKKDKKIETKKQKLGAKS